MRFFFIDVIISRLVTILDFITVIIDYNKSRDGVFKINTDDTCVSRNFRKIGLMLEMNILNSIKGF